MNSRSDFFFTRVIGKHGLKKTYEIFSDVGQETYLKFLRENFFAVPSSALRLRKEFHVPIREVRTMVSVEN